jgi:hypothetical protein
VALVLTNNVVLLFTLLVAPVLIGVVRNITYILLRRYPYNSSVVEGCPVCEVLVCVVRGTGSGMLSHVLLVKNWLELVT